MITGVVLAAGEGSRMGRLKQLLPWADSTILGKSLDNLINSAVVDEKIIVVLGADYEAVKSFLENNYSDLIDKEKLKLLKNDDYKRGMMSSVKTALSGLNNGSPYLLFTLADKPFITPEIYRALFREFLKRKSDIFVPKYRGKKGHPVFFKRILQKKALKLSGKGGLRHLFELVPNRIDYYEAGFKEITVDLDFYEEYEKYQNNDYKLI